MGLEIKISEASGVPYYRQIKDQIERKISTGALSLGEKLPSVRELASMSLVSLITIRRAYADLESEGLIVRRQGQGTYVAKEIEVSTLEERLEEGRRLLAKMVEEAKALGLEQAEIVDLMKDYTEGAGVEDE